MRRCLMLLLALLALPAFAQQVVYYKSLTGTGFVINNEGNVITNAHVLQGCKIISVLTPNGEQNASIVTLDEQKDLAVLKTAYLSPTIAPLRWNIQDLKVGDEVIIMGYPGAEGASGHYVFKKTNVTNLSGPQGETRFIQLGSVAAHGNSGGPVLDGSGNVIGVISGIAMTYHADARGQPIGEPVGQADVAITIAALQDFLQAHGIDFYESTSGTVAYGDDELRDNAHHFILPVRCLQSVSDKPFD